MNTEKNEAVARYFERMGRLEQPSHLPDAAAGLLKEAGWVQGHNAADADGTEAGTHALNAARFSVSSALIRTSRETGLDNTMAVKTAIDALADRIRATHPEAHAFEADNDETRPTMRNLTVVMAWNNHPGQSLHEVVKTLLEARDELAEQPPPRRAEDTSPAAPEPARETAEDGTHDASAGGSTAGASTAGGSTESPTPADEEDEQRTGPAGATPEPEPATEPPAAGHRDPVPEMLF